jgi:hypothetical protein
MQTANETCFWEIRSVAMLLEAEQGGFKLTYKSTSPEMPGANLLHQAVRQCDIELVEYLVETRKMGLHSLDDDLCTPFGYVANDELWHDLKENPKSFATVNVGCSELSQITGMVQYLMQQNAPCVYLGKPYEQSWIQTYLDRLSKLASS